MDTMEFISISGTLCIFLLWILVPLVPAVLIYKLFPRTEVTASGPFAGLTLNMSGAFAAYFILCLLSYSWVDHAYGALGDLKRLAWTVKGTFKIVDRDGKVIRAGEDFLSKICIRTMPNNIDFKDTDDDGWFEFYVSEREKKLPRLFIETTHNRRIELKVQEVNYKEKVATIKAITIPGVNMNMSDDAKVQTIRR